ncbi:MAG: tetratricopeptide repeat protein [Opitutales bacterium]|nr:tetratricopeptide repeat protein [Opitutales bacterium]
MRNPVLIILLAVGFCLPAFSGVAVAQASPAGAVPLVDVPVDSLEWARDRLRIEAAESALASGFPAFALELLPEASDRSYWADSVLESVWLIRLRSWVALGNMSRAGAALRAYPLPDNDSLRLIEAAIAFSQNQRSRMLELLAAIDSDRLDRDERAWYALFRALNYQADRNLDVASDWFQRAEQLADSAVLRANFEITRFRQELRGGPPSEATLGGLRETARHLQGELGGFEAARLLAIGLAQHGRMEEALQLIDRQLQMPGLTRSGLRPQFLFLLGMIAGEHSGRGRLALTQLISDTSADLYTLEAALFLLAQGSTDGNPRARFLEALSEWLDSPRPHPLRQQMLALRATLAAAGGAVAEAETDAQALLQNYPDSPLAVEALRLLAQLSWEREPPRYRTAAGYLNRLRQRIPEGARRAQLGLLMADCYYLNGDFVSASDAYSSVLQELRDPELIARALYQQVQSEIEAGRLDRATAILDNAGSEGRLDAGTRWRAEWNLMDALKAGDAVDGALERLENLLSDSGMTVAADTELSVRLAWLRARLTLDIGAPDSALEQSQVLLARLRDGDGSYTQLQGELRDGVISHTLMLIGEAWYALGDASEAQAVFAQLREEFEGSGPAILSFLVEARQSARGDALVDAQQSLIQLVNLFPDSRYAPIALWEAAIHAEGRGIQSQLREAVQLLERLVDDYPDHGLVFYARLKQGDLLRRLNDFGTALIVYDRLIRSHPDHPERYRAEMSRADCLLAQASQDPDRLEDALVAYERLMLLSSAPSDLRAEAVYKAATVYQIRGQLGARAATLWLLAERYLQPDSEQYGTLGASGRYWVGRGLIALAEQLESQGDTAGARRLYRGLVAHQFPGSHLAARRLNTEPFAIP